MARTRNRKLDRESWSNDITAPAATAEPAGPSPPTGSEDQATLSVPEHLHRLWLTLGLDDE